MNRTKFIQNVVPPASYFSHLTLTNFPKLEMRISKSETIPKCQVRMVQTDHLGRTKTFVRSIINVVLVGSRGFGNLEFCHFHVFQFSIFEFRMCSTVRSDKQIVRPCSSLLTSSSEQRHLPTLRPIFQRLLVSLLFPHNRLTLQWIQFF